jgi:hypothetical protein
MVGSTQMENHKGPVMLMINLLSGWATSFDHKKQKKERDEFLKKNGIDENHDPLLKNYDEAVWPTGGIYIHKKMSIFKMNMLASKLLENLTTLEYDPFYPDIKLDTRQQFALMKTLKKLKTWIPMKMTQFKEPISSITYYDKFDFDQHEEIIDNLNDERCDTIKRGISKDGIVCRDNIFLTPHFRQNFEFTMSQEI